MLLEEWVTAVMATSLLARVTTM